MVWSVEFWSGSYSSSGDICLCLNWSGSSDNEESKLIQQLLKMQKHQDLVIGCGSEGGRRSRMIDCYIMKSYEDKIYALCCILWL